MRRPRLQDRPTWKMVVALIAALVLILFAGGRVLNTLDNKIDKLETGQLNARERGYALSAHVCSAEILSAHSAGAEPEDIRTALTNFCSAPERIVYYPQAICAELMPEDELCGSKSNEPVL